MRIFSHKGLLKPHYTHTFSLILRLLSTISNNDLIKNKTLWNKTNLSYEVRKLIRINENGLKQFEKNKNKPDNFVEIKSSGNNINFPTDLNNAIETLQSLEAIKSDLLNLNDDQDVINILHRAQKFGVPLHPPAIIGDSKLKKKDFPVTPRIPYHKYCSSEGLDIFVGRSAVDNDILSCDPTLRDDEDTWLHVSGYAGSHVVVRSKEDLFTLFPKTILEASILAVKNSKAPGDQKQIVHITKCKNIIKPYLSPPGLVSIKGKATEYKIDVLYKYKNLIDIIEKTKNQSNQDKI